VAEERSRTAQLVAFIAMFVGLTLAGTVWSVWRTPISASELLDVVLALPSRLLVLLGALVVGLYVTDVLRYKALGHATSVHITWRAGLDASVANFVFSNITPGSTFGVPATIYMLGRRGVAWDAALAITFIKAFSAAAVIALVGIVFITTGLAEFDWRLAGIVAFTGSVFVILFSLLTFAAFRPAAAQGVVSRVFGWLAARFKARFIASGERVTLRAIDRLALLRTGGITPLVLLVLSHVAYFTVFSSIGVILIYAFGGEPSVEAFASSWVYVAFVFYLAPTPGGAGFAEATSVPFFTAVLPAEYALMMVLCFRSLTLYIQVVIAVPYLLVAGTLRAMTRPAEAPDAPDAPDARR
jgi:glycosyltransferase 2 family protein